MRTCARIFQSNGETNPAVLFFIVINGYVTHRNGIRIDKMVSLRYTIKKIIRLYILFLIGSILGWVLWYASSMNADVVKCTATESIGVLGILLKLTGLVVIFPQYYVNSYCGNAPLITASIIMFFALIYPFVLKVLTSKRRYLFIGLYCAIYIMIFIFSLDNGYNVWWQNASAISFFPYFFMGMYYNGICNKKICKFVIIIGVFFEILLVLFCHGSVGVLLNIFTEIKKLVLGASFGAVIVLLDQEWIRISEGMIYYLGKRSFSMYCIHAPIIIYLLAIYKIDILSIMIVLTGCTEIIYQMIEVKLNKWKVKSL